MQILLTHKIQYIPFLKHVSVRVLCFSGNPRKLTSSVVMGRPNSLAKVELKKGPWTREEDQKLLAYIQENGHGSWRSLPAKAGLQRCGKSCRLRWTNYLRPDIKRGKFSPHEEKAIIRLHALLGNRWSAIAAHLPKRTDNEIKNYWNTRLKKRLARMGIDPTTHKPKNNPPGRHAANLSHMAQWETARLEAEARLARESKLRPNLRVLHKFKPRLLPPPLPPLPLYPAAACLDVLKVWQSRNAASSSCFFGSTAGSLDSPTSTLSFSCNNSNNAVLSSSSAAAAVNPVNNNNNYSSSETVSSNGAMGKMDNSMQLDPHDDQTDDILRYSNNITYGCDAAGAVDLAAPADFGCSTEWVMEEFDDSRNYWNELLNMVSSPAMELPRF